MAESATTTAPSQRALPYRVLPTQPNTAEWLRLRQTQGVGASESPAILGDTAWGTARKIYDQKIAATVEDFTTDLMEFGHLAEPLIVAFMEAHPERYRFIGEIIPAEGLLQSIPWPWLLGTLDRQVRTPGGHVVPLELKSVNDYAAAEWRIDQVGDDDSVFGRAGGERYEVPKKYQVQVQQQMAVTGAPFAYVAAWLGKGRVEILRVERDNAYIEEYLVGRIGDFWHLNVQTRTPPPPTIDDDIWEVWPGKRGDVIEADEDTIDLIGQWRIAGADKRDLLKEYKQLGFEIATYMGDHTELAHPETGEVIHTLRGQNTARSTDFDLLQEKYPDAYAECVRPPGWTRVHRPTKGKV